MKKQITGITAAVVLAAALALTGAQSASASTYLGGISVWNACSYQNGPPSSVILVQNNVNGWRCHYEGGWNGVNLGVNLTTECKRVHGGSAYAAYTNFNDPYSWGCYR